MELSTAPDRKLLPDETPWRSAVYVPGHISTDGHDYAPGEPIPASEAVRQGLAEEDAVRPTPPKKVCFRCRGTGRYMKVPPKGHDPETCRCKFCGPCHKCDGSGFVEG